MNLKDCLFPTLSHGQGCRPHSHDTMNLIRNRNQTNSHELNEGRYYEDLMTSNMYLPHAVPIYVKKNLFWWELLLIKKWNVTIKNTKICRKKVVPRTVIGLTERAYKYLLDTLKVVTLEIIIIIINHHRSLRTYFPFILKNWQWGFYSRQRKLPIFLQNHK